LADAVVHGRGEWVRNNDREREIGPEVGDVLMMLCVTAERLNVEPLEEMLKKFAKKGYPIHEQSERA
jgi:NTP pyrophosphatase (non-canonical NTP hydrolase)